MQSIESEYFGENIERNFAIPEINQHLNKFEGGLPNYADPTS